VVDQKNKEIEVFKSLKKPDTYLYLGKSQKFEDLPSELRDSFGQYELVLEMELSPERNLARADATQVLLAIASRGFYLQLPPTIEELSNG
tara:strand:- start:704 stop:973 length:270 start_codon:yes stop_codon:yes gene_type:complete